MSNMNDSASRAVTEADFRMPQFRDAKPEDYERTAAGIARKDRYREVCLKVAALLGYKPDEVTDSAEDLRLLSFSIEDFIERAKAAGVEPYAYDELPQ